MDLQNKTNETIFINRLLLYRLQYIIAAIIASILSIVIILFICENNAPIAALAPVPWFFSFFNITTYFYSKFLAEKYGIEMFGDLDQEWLKEYQGFDSKAFGEIFSRLIQCRKIAGFYIIPFLVLSYIIDVRITFLIGLIYIGIYFAFYRSTYFDAAIADRIPRAFGGGIIISRILDSKFDHKYDKSIAEKKNVK